MQFSSISPLKSAQSEEAGQHRVGISSQSAGNAGYFHGQDTGKNTYVDGLFMNG